MNYILEALASLVSPLCLSLMFAGVISGIIFGAIPGLGGGILTVLVLPLTYKLDPVVSIAFLCAIYIGGTSGSYIGSVLMGIPGDVASVSTVYDGYEFTKKGDPVRALSACTVANFIGTIPSMLVCMVACPVISAVAIKLGPWEFFALSFCAISLIVALSKENIFKGLMAAGIALLIKCMGLAPVCGTPRFTFNNYYLSGGIPMVCMFLGVFAGSTILLEYGSNAKADTSRLVKVSKFRWPGKDLSSNIFNIIRSWAIGLVIGILPGMGSGLSNVVAYASAKSSSKHPEQFGKGCIDGVIAPEVANNASVGGALIPFISLGIPGDGSTALLLGALTVQGVVTGPLMIRNYPSVVYMIYLACMVGALMVLLFQILGMPIFPSILKIPYHYLYPVITVLIFLGAFVSQGNLFALVLTLAMMLIGVFMAWAGLPTTPFILTYVLGELLETNFRRAMSYSRNGFASFFTRPASCVMLVIAIGFILYNLFSPAIKAVVAKKKAQKQNNN